jgi:hypothetical protein
LPAELTGQRLLKLSQREAEEVERKFGWDQMFQRFRDYLKEVDDAVAARQM